MTPEFERILALKDSPYPDDRQRIHCGNLVPHGPPALVDIRSWQEHGLLVGSNGSGKTAALMRTMAQLMPRREFSFVIFDAKCDTLELLGEAKASGLPVKHWIDRVGYGSYVFNLFEQRFWPHITPLQQAATLGAAFGFSHKLAEYGPSFFGTMSTAIVTRALEKYRNLPSLRALREAMFHLVTHKDEDFPSDARKAALEALMVIDRAAKIYSWNIVGNRCGIDLCSLFETPQVVYFGLPSAIAHDTVGEQCRLPLMALFQAAAFAKRRVPVFVVIDEAPQVLGSQLLQVVRLSRSAGLGLILTAQSLRDLKTADADFSSALRTNARIQWYFNISDWEEQKLFSECTGTTIETNEGVHHGWGPQGWGLTGISQQPTVVPYLSLNEVKRASANPRQSILMVTQNSGAMQGSGFPMIVENDFHISHDEYVQRKNTPWPKYVIKRTVLTKLPKEEDPPVHKSAVVVEEQPIIVQRRK